MKLRQARKVLKNRLRWVREMRWFDGIRPPAKKTVYEAMKRMGMDVKKARAGYRKIACEVLGKNSPLANHLATWTGELQAVTEKIGP